MNLHEFLDCQYGADGAERLVAQLGDGQDPSQFDKATGESLLHVAVRRRRLDAVKILLDHGANIDSTTPLGKTAYAHAIRRGFSEIVTVLQDRGAKRDLNAADQLAVAVVAGDLDSARNILEQNPKCVRTGNTEEDRLLADVAGRENKDAVAFLVDAGADLNATGLDDGTALHQAAWFGQPQNAKLLIAAGASLEHFDATHGYSPLGWAVHGSRYSGGAEQRGDRYEELVKMLLAAGSRLEYPPEIAKRKDESYRTELLRDASPAIRQILEQCTA